MVEIFSLINGLLDSKIIQWALLGLTIFLLLSGVWAGFKYNKLQLEHAYLKVTAAQLSDGLLVQNAKVKELGDEAKLYKDNYLKTTAKAQEVQVSTTKSLKTISEYVFDGDCSGNVHSALSLIKKGGK